MTEINRGRWSAAVDDEFVVFLIGMRINKPWKPWKWVPVARAMGPMQAELRANPDLGCLHIENWFGRTTVSLQYWTDFESVDAYARGGLHLPAWRDFNRRVRDSGDVGIWHETYRVPPGGYETVYGNMPRFGLASAGAHRRTAEIGQSAQHRIGSTAQDRPVVEPY